MAQLSNLRHARSQSPPLTRGSKKPLPARPPARGIPFYIFIVLYIIIGTGLLIRWHTKRHQVFSWMQAALAFFLVINFVVCFWEMVLFVEGPAIEVKAKHYAKYFKGRSLELAGEMFRMDISIWNWLKPSTWSEIWSCYSTFDDSYGNRQSFGYLIDVGNGFSTLLPTVAFLVGMTAHNASLAACDGTSDGTSGSDGGGCESKAFVSPLSARALGVIGMCSFYQEFYGTVVYALSFVVNRRHKKLNWTELVLFVFLTNGLWIVFPLVGMAASWRLIDSNDFSVFL